MSSFKKMLAVGALALTAACSSGPIDVYQTCTKALDGVSDPMADKLKACQRDVYYRAWHEGQAAAQKYRDLPR